MTPVLGVFFGENGLNGRDGLDGRGENVGKMRKTVGFWGKTGQNGRFFGKTGGKTRKNCLFGPFRRFRPWFSGTKDGITLKRDRRTEPT